MQEAAERQPSWCLCPSWKEKSSSISLTCWRGQLTLEIFPKDDEGDRSSAFCVRIRLVTLRFLLLWMVISTPLHARKWRVPAQITQVNKLQQGAMVDRATQLNSSKWKGALYAELCRGLLLITNATTHHLWNYRNGKQSEHLRLREQCFPNSVSRIWIFLVQERSKFGRLPIW